jgi:hypothetical protein
MERRLRSPLLIAAPSAIGSAQGPNVGSSKHASASLLRAPSPRSRARGVSPAAGGTPERSRGAGGSGKGGGRLGDEARNPTDRPGGQTGGRPRLVVGAIARRSGGGDWPPRRRLGGQAERREEPPHGVGLGHRAEPPRAPAAIAQPAYEGAKARYMSNAPLQKVCTPDDNARAVLWLLEGSELVTGEFIIVDGGSHLGGSPTKAR